MDYDKIAAHFGHSVVVAIYGAGQEATVECEDCYEVIVTAERQYPDAAETIASLHGDDLSEWTV